MSTIGSEYSAHQRSIDDLEQDYAASRKKAKQREEARESKLERDLDETHRRGEEKMRAAVDDIRDKYEKNARAQREIDQRDRARLASQLYDKDGRNAQNRVRDYADQAKAASQSAADAQEKYEQRARDLEQYYDRRSDAQEQRKSEEIERVADSYRKQLAEATGSDSDENQRLRDYKERLQKAAAGAIDQAQEQMKETRRQNQQLVADHGREREQLIRKGDEALEQRLRAQKLETRKTLDEHALRERASRGSENALLRQQLKEVTDHDKKRQSEWNHGREDAIRELEHDWRSTMDNQASAHAIEKQKLHADAAELEGELGRKFNATLREREVGMATAIKQLNEEHREQLSNATSEYDRSLAHVQMQHDHEKKVASENAEKQRIRMAEQRDEAMRRQADVFQNTLKRTREGDQVQMESLQRALYETSTTDDPGMISAAAERTVRNQVGAMYEKQFAAEAERNAAARDHLYNEYTRRIHEARQENQFDATRIRRDSLQEQEQLRTELVTAVRDSEYNKQTEIQKQQQLNERTSDTMMRMREASEGELRRHYEGVMGAREDDLNSRYATLRQETDFQQRQMKRDFAFQTNDLIRSYEKKLADQKLGHETAMKDLRQQSDAAMRESDRRVKQALDEQARSNEHRIAEMESQAKERERVLNRNHEDELEKVKRANALLLSKKG